MAGPFTIIIVLILVKKGRLSSRDWNPIWARTARHQFYTFFKGEISVQNSQRKLKQISMWITRVLLVKDQTVLIQPSWYVLNTWLCILGRLWISTSCIFSHMGSMLVMQSQSNPYLNGIMQRHNSMQYYSLLIEK